MPANKNVATILCFDPGERNFAVTLFRLTNQPRNGKLAVKIIHSGYITNTMINLTTNARSVSKKLKRGVDKETKQAKYVKVTEDFASLIESHAAYKKEILGHLKVQPDMVSTERFQNRGMKTRSSETVNIMNGILLELCVNRRINFHMVMASQWKNWINKIISLDELYQIAKNRDIQPHTVDTIFQGLYTKLMLVEDGEWAQLTEIKARSIVLSLTYGT